MRTENTKAVTESGSVPLRNIMVALVGQEFVVDCCRHVEGLVSDVDLKGKPSLIDDGEQR